MRIISRIASAGSLLLLGACVSMPTGPSVMVLPGTGKSFDQFRVDDMDCRQFASSQVGGATADQAAARSTPGPGAAQLRVRTSVPGLLLHTCIACRRCRSAAAACARRHWRHLLPLRRQTANRFPHPRLHLDGCRQ